MLRWPRMAIVDTKVGPSAAGSVCLWVVWLTAPRGTDMYERGGVGDG